MWCVPEAAGASLLKDEGFRREVGCRFRPTHIGISRGQSEGRERKDRLCFVMTKGESIAVAERAANGEADEICQMV